MSADDRDDDLEGDELKSLRSVWVSMRESDEDPPDRGLAALMAAAREKASELAEPPRASWWQKILATLRRPPVLALASVTVLLGGALFVMQRSDKLASESAPAPALEEKAQRDVAPSPPSAGASEVPAAIAQPDPAPPPAEVKTPPPRAVKPPRTRPASPPPEEPAKPSPQGGGLILHDKPDLDAELATKPEPATTTRTTRAPVRKTESVDATTTDAFGSNDVKAATQTGDEGGADRGKLVTQLVKQCESAAARGDCAAVRVIAGRIKSEDASAYSQRVMRNSSIARCLDAAATTVK